jgi:amidase
MEGAQALAPSFDTAGWFAKDAETLRDVGKVLLSLESEGRGGGRKAPFELKRWLVAADAFDRATPEISRALFEAVASSKREIEELLSPPSEVLLWDPEAGGSEGAKDAFRFAQAKEALRPEVLGAFLDTDPELGPVARERIEWARTVTAEQESAALGAREALRSRLDALLAGDAVVALPAAPDTAPLAGSGADVAPSRGVLLELTAAAGLAGLPQLVLPAAVLPPATVTGGGGPVGLSFIGPRGSDLELLELGVRLSRAMGL